MKIINHEKILHTVEYMQKYKCIFKVISSSTIDIWLDSVILLL